MELNLDTENELLPEVSKKEVEKFSDGTKLKGDDLEEYILAGQIIHSRILGMDYVEIANSLNTTEAKVKNALARNLAELSPVEDKEALRGLQLKRYEMLLKTQMSDAESGDKNATRVAISIMNGINAISDLYRPIKEESEEMTDSMQDMLEAAIKIVEEARFGVEDIIDAEIVMDELEVENSMATSFIEKKLSELRETTEAKLAADGE